MLWQGHCSVHQMFRAEHVHQFRQRIPGIKILVHPECMQEVNDLADVSGSTGKIIQTIEQAPARQQVGDRHRTAPGQPLKQEHPSRRFTSCRRWSACAPRCTGSIWRISAGAWRTSPPARR
jgi:quinolinate synthase